MNRNEVVVITGASAGVGRATARAFAKRGANIGLLARGRDGLEAARQEIEAEGGTALVLPADVSRPEQVEAAAEAVEKNFGAIDIWINNAMVSVFSPIKEMTADEFKRVTEVTYLGCVYGTLSALRRMLPRDHGVIVEVGSALAYRGIPLQAAYCGPSMRFRDSSILCAASCCTIKVVWAWRWFSCRRSTRRSSRGLKAACRESRNRCRRSSSRKLPPMRSSGQRFMIVPKFTSAGPRSRRSSAIRLRRALPIGICHVRVMRRSKPTSRWKRSASTIFGAGGSGDHGGFTGAG